MPWRPKIKISKPKYTFGGELKTPSGDDYVGRYFEDYKGNKYDGANPNNSTTELNAAEETPQVKRPLGFELNTPTQEDYNRGSFTRFFLKDTRNGKIAEVKRNTYLRERVFNTYMQGTNILWRLKGPIEDKDFNGRILKGARNANKESIEQAAQEFKGLELYLTEYTQFIREDESKAIHGLYTPGKELYYRGTLEEYVGHYHIHPALGFMEGRHHIEGAHKYLDPQNESIKVGFINKYPFLKDIFESEKRIQPKLPVVSLSDREVPEERKSDNVLPIEKPTEFEVKEPKELPIRKDDKALGAEDFSPELSPEEIKQQIKDYRFDPTKLPIEPNPDVKVVSSTLPSPSSSDKTISLNSRKKGSDFSNESREERLVY